MLICCLHITSHTHTHTQTTVSACTPPLGCPPGWFVAHSFHAFHRWLQTKLQLNKQTKQEQIRVCSVWLLPLPQLPSHPWLSSSATHRHTTTLSAKSARQWPHLNACASMHLYCGSILWQNSNKKMFPCSFSTQFSNILCSSRLFSSAARNPRRCTCQIIEMCFRRVFPQFHFCTGGVK